MPWPPAGLIPADGEIWKTRRRAIVPSLHRKYIESMVAMFGDSALHGARTLQAAALVRPGHVCAVPMADRMCSPSLFLCFLLQCLQAGTAAACMTLAAGVKRDIAAVALFRTRACVK